MFFVEKYTGQCSSNNIFKDVDTVVVDDNIDNIDLYCVANDKVIYIWEVSENNTYKLKLID